MTGAGPAGPNWAAYSEAQQGREVRPLCTQVLALAGAGAGRRAIELGCGAGIESRAMLLAGWDVLAIDAEPGTEERVRATVGDAARVPGRLDVRIADFASLSDLPAAGLIYAGYSLPFTPPPAFARLWAVVGSVLQPEAWFAGDFFGDRDTWASNPDLTIRTEAEVRELFAGWSVQSFVERDEDGMAFDGPKHWHTFSVIARR